ncbi:MAG TPA: PIG-L family deacetylase [Pyrinomonadaceae bacterium]|nr:PIG-L family deacetylase [Pyrinomonadaceae bacterium]
MFDVHHKLHDPSTRVLFVVAHPDDEVIGAGGSLLSRFEHCQVVHVTDGAPANMLYAQHAGFNSTFEYADARREEAAMALALAGIAENQIIELGVTDQQLSYQMVSVARRLAKLLNQIEPDIVITQPYEGGHPDHDATAFAVHLARRLLHDEKTIAPEIFELTSYHRRHERVVYSEFLPRDGNVPVTFALAQHEKSLKQKMFECFHTQREVLCWFPIEVERFRKAPPYNFTRPPHAGKLHYDYFDWGVTGEQWQRLAREALGVLDREEIRAARDFERNLAIAARRSKSGWWGRVDISGHSAR